MERPNIEGTKTFIMHECCGRHDFTKFCEMFGCSNMLELINYIEYLEDEYHKEYLNNRKGGE